MQIKEKWKIYETQKKNTDFIMDKDGDILLHGNDNFFTHPDFRVGFFYLAETFHGRAGIYPECAPGRYGYRHDSKLCQSMSFAGDYLDTRYGMAA